MKAMGKFLIEGLLKVFAVVLFYLFFVPAGFILRLCRGGLLIRKDEKRKTYWVPRVSQ